MGAKLIHFIGFEVHRIVMWHITLLPAQLALTSPKICHLHVLSHCHLSTIPLIPRMRWKRKQHFVGSILANRVDIINSSLRRCSVVEIELADCVSANDDLIPVSKLCVLAYTWVVGWATQKCILCNSSKLMIWRPYDVIISNRLFLTTYDYLPLNEPYPTDNWHLEAKPSTTHCVL